MAQNENAPVQVSGPKKRGPKSCPWGNIVYESTCDGARVRRRMWLLEDPLGTCQIVIYGNICSVFYWWEPLCIHNCLLGGTYNEKDLASCTSQPQGPMRASRSLGIEIGIQAPGAFITKRYFAFAEMNFNMAPAMQVWPK
jgi:hypothetical protein